MEIITLFPDGFASNCYIISSRGRALVVDPSVPVDRIRSSLAAEGLRAEGILLTHGHFDHIFFADALRAELSIPLYVHGDDAEMLTDSRKNAYSLFCGGELSVNRPDGLLADGDVISLGDESLTVIHTPGHSRGSVCFDVSDKLISGDTLFADSFGRCDLWGGDKDALIRSLSRLENLAGERDRAIYPGHGERAMLTPSLMRIKSYLF